ncbi:MAG: aromatic ring-hydroxylating dioxygenase subunit alpha [Burkholderiales bacterium]|nr:aromatic ring-hydroxylating dioxygenase subunit alpha [Burkholderiales bacterium]
MPPPLSDLIAAYDASAPLERARTIPAAWYTDPRMFDLERRTVFARTWQMVGHTDQVRAPGQYLTAEVAGEPVVVVRGGDGVLRGFFNVCRHHAAAVLTAPAGRAERLRCPYHGWTYTLEGALLGAPEFAGVADFDKRDHGLVPIACATWEQWVFVRITPDGPALEAFVGAELAARVAAAGLGRLRWFERRRYTLACNWKVYVDNYLDGGYHVPHLHKGLSSVIDNTAYAIETGARWCEQSSPLSAGGDARTAAVRRGDRARYWWLHPNFMINAYEGVLDTNLVVPLGPDRTEVIFDYWFADTSPAARDRNLESIAVSERIQDEDVAICASVQRGLRSRAYEAGRLSVRREAGEWLFHRLLHRSLADGAA